jgi:hypothetical protein
MKEYGPLVPTELLFNLDETGLRDWEERKPKRILILTEAKACCVPAAADADCPLLISVQPAARGVFHHQISDDIDLRIEIALSPDVTSKIFEREFNTVLILALEINRELLGCGTKPAILFCNNCSANMSVSMLQKFARHGGLVIMSPSHIVWSISLCASRISWLKYEYR